jgi:hypothetical protein
MDSSTHLTYDPDWEAKVREPILQFFDYEHLPEYLQEIGKEFKILAYEIVRVLPVNDERSEALRKILEAKDSAVRARIYKKERI